MMILLRWVLFALAVLFIGWLLPGISISGFLAALILVVVIALINALLRPLINFLTLPINFLTLGLFGLVINALLFMLAGFHIAPPVEARKIPKIAQTPAIIQKRMTILASPQPFASRW